jgi:lysophospholipase L1-like esterase
MSPIRYVAVGDSLTEGYGVDPREAWPTLLINHIRTEGTDFTLTENLARSGRTSAQALAEQLPRFRELQPNFATLLIGANDVFRGVPVADFVQNLAALLDGMLAELPAPERLIIITIPDYRRTPIGFVYGRSDAEAPTTQEYNAVIRREAAARGLTLVDMYKESKWVMFDIGLLAEDGIHPSVAGHKKWEEAIYPIAQRLLP